MSYLNPETADYFGYGPTVQPYNLPASMLGKMRGTPALPTGRDAGACVPCEAGALVDPATRLKNYQWLFYRTVLGCLNQPLRTAEGQAITRAMLDGESSAQVKNEIVRLMSIGLDTKCGEGIPQFARSANERQLLPGAEGVSPRYLWPNGTLRRYRIRKATIEALNENGCQCPLPKPPPPQMEQKLDTDTTSTMEGPDPSVPWGWIVGGSAAVLVVGGGAIWYATRQKKRRRR